MEQILKFIDEHQKEYIDRLRENVEIASVSGKTLRDYEMKDKVIWDKVTFLKPLISIKI